MMWNLSATLEEDLSTERYEYKEYRETNITVNNLDKYDIFTKDLDARIRLKAGYLDVRGKILNLDGTNIGEDEEVALINNGFNLFERAELQIGNKCIELIDRVGITTTVRNLVNFTDDYSKSIATNMLWLPDTSQYANKNRFKYDGNIDKLDTNQAIKEFTNNIKHNREFNNGFLERWKLTRGKKQLNLWLPLAKLFGFCEDIDKVLTGVQIKVILYKNRENDILYSGSDKTYKFQLDYISLWLPHLTPSLPVLAEYESLLASGQKIDLIWESSNCYSSDVKNENSSSWRITTNQHAISNIFIVFQKKNRINNQKQNNMIFDNLLLERSNIRINGKKYPEEDLITSFLPESLNYSRAFTSFLAAGLKDWGTEIGSIVTKNSFAELYPIFHYDCSKHEPYKSAMPLEVIFEWSLGNDVNRGEYIIYCVIVSEVKMQLDLQNRQTNIIH